MVLSSKVLRWIDYLVTRARLHEDNLIIISCRGVVGWRGNSTLGLGIGAEDESVKSIYYDGILTLVFIIVLDNNVG